MADQLDDITWFDEYSACETLIESIIVAADASDHSLVESLTEKLIKIVKNIAFEPNNPVRKVPRAAIFTRQALGITYYASHHEFEETDIASTTIFFYSTHLSYTLHPYKGARVQNDSPFFQP
jgi:hypothetical protein